MKKTILLIALLMCFKFAVTQAQSQNKPPTMKIPAIMDTLTKEQFDKILNKEFNSVINSSGKTTIGNYASTDIKDGRVAFNATKNLKNGNMFSINANGGITDGFFAIFNQTKINSNVGVDFKYNIRFNSSSISYHTNEITKLKTKLSNADSEFTISKTIHEHDSILLKSRRILLTAEINSINQQLTNPNLTPEQKANLEYQLALKNLQEDSLQLKQLTFISSTEAEEQSKAKKQKDKNSAVSNFEYTGIFFHWVSLGGGFQNNNFNQFNPKYSTLDSQVIKQNNVIWNGTIEYNLYRWNQYSRPTYYLLIGVKGSIDDNFSDLSKIELNDTRIYGDSTNQRTTSKKFNAYKGDYKTKLLSAKVYFDLYRFFFKNSAAIHVYPEVVFKQENEPLYNTGIGLLYSFKDSKDKDNKAKLHAELYFKLSDLSNNSNSNLPVLKRNELGLRLSIPVSFLNF